MPLHITTVHPFDPWGTKTGGIETFIRAFIQHSPNEVTHSVIGVSEDPSLRPLHQWNTLPFDDIALRFLPIMADRQPNKRSWVPLFFRYPLLLRTITLPDQSDLIIFHRIEPSLTFPNSQAKKVLFIHGNPQEITGTQSEVKWKYVPWLYKTAENKALSSCDYVHVVSRTGLQYFQDRNQKQSQNCCFQPTGFNESIFTPGRKYPDLLKPYGLNPNTPTILFAGRLEAQKNPILALESFFQLRKQTEAQLIIAGEGRLLTTMRNRCAESPYANDVTFLGRVSSSSLAKWMNNSDLFLMTSHFEGMPITVLEALACGLPVVSTDVGEMNQIINDGVNGKIVSNPTAYTLSNTLLEILGSRNQYSKHECASSVESFRNSVVMDTLYQQLNTYAENS